MIVFSSIVLYLDMPGFIFTVSLITSYFIPYFILRYVRETGYDAENEEIIKNFKKENGELAKINGELNFEVAKLQNKLEAQKEIVELSKEMSQRVK
jgi:hypothetical protein